ncbi:MAG: class I SAM-dependent methyltransferase [Promethearchaeota archaeon]
MDIKEVKRILGTRHSVNVDFLNQFVKKLKLKKDARILDIGTGAGVMAIVLALNNHKIITGEPETDNSKYAKQDWQTNAKKVNVDHLITFKSFNAEEMPFENKSFDAIFIYGSLHHIDNKVSTLKECIRILKLNGILCIIEPTRKGIELIQKINPSHPDAVDPREYAQNFPLSVEVKKNPMVNAFIFKEIKIEKHS